jgi:hypothetical protein
MLVASSPFGRAFAFAGYAERTLFIRCGTSCSTSANLVPRRVIRRQSSRCWSWNSGAFVARNGHDLV